MLVMLTRRRARRLVLKASEPEGLEAYGFPMRRCEPISTVTTVSKLVDLLATSFRGDLTDVLTDFERRITSWEHDANETLSGDQNRGCHQGSGRKVEFVIMC